MSGIESIQLSHDDIKRLVIENTTSRWETAKGLVTKIFYVIILGVVLYWFWVAWEFYFWIDFFLSLPFAIWIATKVLRVPIRWFVKIDLTTQTLYFYGIPKVYRWNGQALMAKDNNGNVLNIVHTIQYSTIMRTVKSTFSYMDYDRFEMLHDFGVLDRMLTRMEKLQISHYDLKRNFWNRVISKIRELQLRSVEIPISEILAKPVIAKEQAESRVGESLKKEIGRVESEQE